MTRIAGVASALTALAGLIFLAFVIVLPQALYQDAFARDVSLIPEIRLVMSLPIALGAGALLLVALSFMLWRQRAWSYARRVHFYAVTAAAVVLSLMIYGWNVVPLGF